MKKNGTKQLLGGMLLIALFALWTTLVQTVDVQPVGPNGTQVGFSAFNLWFHRQTGVHMTLYLVTDWLGLVPLLICMLAGVTGLIQLTRRRNLLKVDLDLSLLGVYYIIVVLAYLLFEMIPINYRPVLIDGRMEASYPSSTTLLVLSAMPTAVFQAYRRMKSRTGRRACLLCACAFSAFMVTGRLISGVHWFSDIVGAALLSAGLFSLYKASVRMCCGEKN